MELFVIVAVTHFIALLSPGPDFFLILTTLLREGKPATRLVSIGIAIGNALILFSIFLSFIFIGKTEISILPYIKIVGACYLLYLSLLCFHQARVSFLANIHHEAVIRQPLFKLKNIVSGLQSSLFNPKNILFYSSLMLMVSERFNAIQKISLSVWMVGVVLGWNLFLVQILGQNRWLDFLKRFARWLYIMAGLSFFAFSIFLVSMPS